MAVSRDYLTFVLEQLAGLSGVVSRRMFGGVGLYSGEFFFGLIADDVLYLRVDDSNRNDYVARGMGQFRPYSDRPHRSMSYYEIPADVLESASETAEWAKRSVDVAIGARGRTARGRTKGKARKEPRRIWVKLDVR